MIGCPYSVRRLANAVKFCLVPTLFLIILGAFPAALSLDNLSLLGVSPAFAGDDSEDDGHDEADSDGMICNNDDSVLNVGLLKFAKSSESSKKSNFFDPHIKATYRTYGWIPFTGEYFVIQDEDTDLRHAECGWLIAMRFCARYAVGEGGTLGDGTLVEESDHGYEPGDVNDAEGTCVSPYRARIIDGEEAAADPDNDPYDPEYDPYYIEPGRLCVYEDSMDGMDTDPDENFFHKQVPNEPPMAEYVERYAGIGARTGGFKDKVMPVLVIFVSPIIGLLAALIMSTYNHVVMLFTTGSSLGCVDVPLAPKPPIFFYQLSPPPPWPQVYPVHNDEEKWTEYVATQPSVYLATVNDPRHQDYWRHHENKDWFYPKIGIMLGETSFKFDSGNRIIDAAETDRTRVTAILTGDFYGEGGPNGHPDDSDAKWGREEAGYGRGEDLPPLTKDNPDGSRNQIRKIDGKESGDQLRIETEDGWVGYNITTEVYNDEVCAYIVDTTWEFRDTDGDDLSLDEEPELIGCVKRPKTYIGRNSPDPIPAPPLPQVYHPWHDQNFSAGIKGTANAVSNFEHVYVWQWLRDDPRHPADMEYGLYNTRVVEVPPRTQEEKDNKDEDDHEFALDLGMRSTTDSQAEPITDGAPVISLIPKMGCDGIPFEEDHVYGGSVDEIIKEDYFGRKKNRRARIHGKVYCMNNFDTDGNGIIAGAETDMCAQGMDLTSIGQTLQIIKTPKVSDHYEPVTFPNSVTVKIPTLPYTSSPLNLRDFEGTEVNLPANTDINTLSGDSFIIGTRILSNNVNLGCSKELGEIVITSEGEGEDEIVTETQEILSTNSVECNQMGGKYFRDAPDPFRGEILVDKGNGTFRLMRRVDRDGNPPNKLIRISPHKLYITSVPTSGGGTMELNLPPPVEGECPLALMSDKITFRQQLNNTNVCLLNADGSPDETTVAAGGLINTPIADRRYYSPDQYRGESLMVQSTLEQGLGYGYCVTMPPSMCPRVEVHDKVDHWPAGNALPYCESGACSIEAIDHGVVEGVCEPGYGTRGTICNSGDDHPNPPGCRKDVSSVVSSEKLPTRRCAARTTLLDSIGEWGDVITECERLECPAMTTNYKDEGADPDITYRCDWAATKASSDDGDSWAGAIHSSHPSDSHSGTKCGGSPGNTHESRRKRCNENGEWATNSCSWNQNADDLNNSSCSDSRNDTVVP